MNLCDYTGILGDSDDSDDDSNSKTLLDASWESLSIMDRLGLKSSAELTEEVVENTVTQFALGFHCDQYTLRQRLQAERHERTVAEENLQRELRQTREMLQVLYERLPELESREMVQQVKNNLQMMESDVDNVMKTAETLGAAHQEARVSHAVELMSVHMEHLKRRHNTESEELLEVRKLLYRRKGRLHSDSTDDRDLFRHSSQQPTRRRVSITLLPTQSELKHLQASFLENCAVTVDVKKPTEAQADRRQEVVPTDSLMSSLNEDDDEDSSVFQSVSPLRRRRQPDGRSLEGEESEGGAESSPELRFASNERPLSSWRSSYGWTLPLFVLTLLMATLLYVFMAT